MKTIYVKDLAAGVPISGETFAITEKKMLTDKNGQAFYDLVLADKTGQVPAKIFSGDMGLVEKQAIELGRVVMIDAHVNDFKGEIQLAIKKLSEVDETRLEDYITSSRFDPDTMFAELLEIISKIQNPHIKTMLDDIFADQETARKFKYWPAANSYHHAFRSGLLQHTLECLALVVPFERFYPDVDYDIVRAGVILHDIGKIVEIDASGIASRYTVKGSALSHIYIGTEYVNKYLPKDAPENIRVHLIHIVLSHNGEREEGAPIEPITTEAQIVSVVDDASSFVQQYDNAMKASTNEFGMTDLNRQIGGWMWAGRRDSDNRLD
jgi:3'-5' exoribonuclease